MIITKEYLEHIENSSKTFYIVAQGYETGIWGDWHSTSTHVIGFPRAKHFKEKSSVKAIKSLEAELSARSKIRSLSLDELETLLSCRKLIDNFERIDFPSLI
jgi:hypothetical protein